MKNLEYKNKFGFPFIIAVKGRNKYQILLNKKVLYFIQVNLGSESQKSGVMPNEIDDFYNYCTQNLSLNIIGLMCLPPVNLNPDLFFKKWEVY